MMIIAYTNPDTGTVSIMHPFHREDTWTDEQFFRFHAMRCPHGTRDAILLPTDAQPSSVNYQGAWFIAGQHLGIDMVKARDIYRDKLRVWRNEQWPTIDHEYMRALESGNQEAMAEIGARKDALRQITLNPAIEDAQSIEELEAINPALFQSPRPAEAKAATSPQSSVPAPVHPEISLPPAPTTPAFTIRELISRASDEDPLAYAPVETPASPPKNSTSHNSEPPPLPAEHARFEPAPEHVSFAPVADEKDDPVPAAFASKPLETSDEELRQQAMSRINYAVMISTNLTFDEQIRYEVAMQAFNGNTDALGMLQEESGIMGMPAKSLAEKIIAQRALQETRVMRVHARRAEAVAAMAGLTGEAILALELRVVDEIMGEKNGTAQGTRA